MRLLSRRNRERILQKWNEFEITTTRKPPPSPFRDRSATKSLQKKGTEREKGKRASACRRLRLLIRSWRIKEKENFLNRNASTKLPFHIDRRGMNFVN